MDRALFSSAVALCSDKKSSSDDDDDDDDGDDDDVSKNKNKKKDVPRRSPEVAFNCKRLSPAIDLWALGVHSTMLVAGCEKFFFPMVDFKKESKKDVEELLNRMVFVAGPALAAWPGIRETPGWQSHAKILQGNLYSASAREALVATLAHSDCAQPRAHLDPRTVEVVLGLLSWDPAKRTTASQAMESFLFPGRAEAGSAPMQPGGGQSSTLASPLDRHSPSQASPHGPLPGSGATSASGSLAGGSGGTSAQKRAASKPEISPKRRCLEAQASADTPQSSAREALVATLAHSDCAQPRAHLDPRTVEVVLGLLSWDPAKRTTASQAMESFLFPGRAEAGSAPMQPGGGQSSTLASPLDRHSPSQASPHGPLPGSGATSASGSLAGGSGGTSAQKRAASKPEISPKRRCLEAQASADTPQSLKNSEGCLCSGQCSRKACDKARGSGKVKGHICERARDTCVPGSQACSECRCEIDGCPKLRTRLAGASGRFCSKHCKLDQVSQHEYTTRDGRKLKYPHAWDLALKCAAKVNFWERILGLPDDGAQAPS